MCAWPAAPEPPRRRLWARPLLWWRTRPWWTCPVCLSRQVRVWWSDRTRYVRALLVAIPTGVAVVVVGVFVRPGDTWQRWVLGGLVVANMLHAIYQMVNEARECK